MGCSRLGPHPSWGHGVRVRHTALRPGHRRGAAACAVRAPGRAYPGKKEDSAGGGGVEPRSRAEVQRALHIRRALQDLQRDLQTLLRQEPAGPNLLLRPGVDRSVRYRDRLRGGHEELKGSLAGYVDRILKGEKPADLPAKLKSLGSTCSSPGITAHGI